MSVSLAIQEAPAFGRRRLDIEAGGTSSNDFVPGSLSVYQIPNFLSRPMSDQDRNGSSPRRRYRQSGRLGRVSLADTGLPDEAKRLSGTARRPGRSSMRQHCTTDNRRRQRGPNRIPGGGSSGQLALLRPSSSC